MAKPLTDRQLKRYAEHARLLLSDGMPYSARMTRRLLSEIRRLKDVNTNLARELRGMHVLLDANQQAQDPET